MRVKIHFLPCGYQVPPITFVEKNFPPKLLLVFSLKIS